MSCKEFERQIVLFSELGSSEQAKVTAHLTTCGTCSELFVSANNTKKLVHRIGKVPIEIEDPFRMTNSIMARIKAEETKQWNLFNLPSFSFEFTFVKYTMAAFSFLLIIFFGMEQLQSPTRGEVISKNQSKKVILNRKFFQDELSKSKAAIHLSLANSCKSPFNITQVNADCLKQRMASK